MGCVSGNHSDCLWILSAPLPRCRHFISGGLAGVGALLLTHPLDGDMGGWDAKFFGFGHGSLNVPIEHHPTIRFSESTGNSFCESQSEIGVAGVQVCGT